MKLTVDLVEVNQLLKERTGAKAYIQTYHASLGRLAIRLDLPSCDKEVCYLVAAGCDYMRGPFRFNSAHLGVTREENMDGSSVVVIRDQPAGFELIASGGIVMVTGDPDRIGLPFEENWLGSPEQ